MERLTLDEMRVLMDGGDLEKERQEELMKLVHCRGKEVVDKVYDELPVEVLSYVYAIILGMNELFPEEDQEAFEKEIVKMFKKGLKEIGNVVISEDAKLYMLEQIKIVWILMKYLKNFKRSKSIGACGNAGSFVSSGKNISQIKQGL